MTDLTAKLRALRNGPTETEDALNDVYPELRRRARAQLRREPSGQTLSPTDLVHEIYLRLVRQKTEWVNRQHFFATASQMMRQVLVDHARAQRSRKRKGVRVEIADEVASTLPSFVDVLAVNAALDELATADPRQAQLVEMRFFGGLTLDEAADALSISIATANRDWRFARAWLARRLTKGSPTDTFERPSRLLKK